MSKMQHRYPATSPAASVLASGSGSPVNLELAQSFSFRDSRLASVASPLDLSPASSGSPTSEPTRLEPSLIRRSQSSSSSDSQKEGRHSTYNPSNVKSIRSKGRDDVSTPSLHILISTSGAKKLAEKKMFRQVVEIGDETNASIRVGRSFSHSWPNSRSMRRSFSRSQDESGQTRNHGNLIQGPKTMIRSSSGDQTEKLHHRATALLRNEPQAMVHSFSGDQFGKVQFRVTTHESNAMSRSSSGSQDCPIQTIDNTVHTRSDDFRLLTVQGTIESVEKATSRILHLLLEHNAARNYLKGFGDALRSLSISASNAKQDISNQSMAVNFVVPGSTNLEELKNGLFVMMARDGFDTNGWAVERSKLQCELAGGDAGLLTVSGNGKVVVKLLVYALRLLYEV
ncbi:hypothetical protein HK102_009285 [Quaeritorhiza haematococci]|nr:hypothetical protein HK102_009285 [Quaeritorhiza haematococci]